MYSQPVAQQQRKTVTLSLSLTFSVVTGVCHSLYLVDIPRTFSSLTFGDLIRFLYDNTPVIPIAMLTVGLSSESVCIPPVADVCGRLGGRL